MGSTRLPGKVLKPLGTKTILEYIIYRLERLSHNAEVIIATSDLKKDEALEQLCNTHNLLCFRGNEANVLERYYSCAKKHAFTDVVRLTGDNPFIDIEELDNLIDLHINSRADYSRSFRVLPKGVGSEIFKFSALAESYRYGVNENHKEHVNEYIEENEDKFNISELNVSKYKENLDISLTVDTPDDYQKACFIITNSKNEYVTTQEAIELCLQYA